MTSKLKFYTDKHIPKAVTKQLQKRGVDVIRCEEAGLSHAEDFVHLEYATRAGRVVISHDTDFIRLHHKWQSEGKKHAGIMFCLAYLQGEAKVGRMIGEIMMYHELIASGAGDIESDVANHLIFVG
jgi:hypothetical protein